MADPAVNLSDLDTVLLCIRSTVASLAGIGEGAVLCRECWKRVSPATSRAVLSAWRALRRRPAEPPRTPTVILATLTAYCEALARAVAEAALGGSAIRLTPAAGPLVPREAGAAKELA